MMPVLCFFDCVKSIIVYLCGLSDLRRGRNGAWIRTYLSSGSCYLLTWSAQAWTCRNDQKLRLPWGLVLAPRSMLTGLSLAAFPARSTWQGPCVGRQSQRTPLLGLNSWKRRRAAGDEKMDAVQ
ncbi:hypothetical protein LY76DRAFT_169685 [Colletotrichum caudatum]|nr:hypothetical protein LY76DRAFT_169685 [Colletotrichum caudatum]